MFIFVIFITLEDRPQKILLQFMSHSLLPMFSFKSFMVSIPTFRWLIHFELIFVYGAKNVLKSFFLLIAVQFSKHLLKRLSFLYLYSCLIYLRLIDYKCMDLFLGVLSCSIDLYFYFVPVLF